MMAEVNQHHPTSPPAASSCRNPNKKTVSPAVSRCISRKPWGIICICQKTLSLQLFHPELFQALPLAAAPGGAPERDADGGVGGQPRVSQVPRELSRTQHLLVCFPHRVSVAGRAEVVVQGRPDRGERDGAGRQWEAGGGEGGRWKPSCRASAARRGPALPRKAEAWPTYGGTKATGPKGADFVFLYFLGKLLSWLRRGGQAGREPA